MIARFGDLICVAGETVHCFSAATAPSTSITAMSLAACTVAVTTASCDDFDDQRIAARRVASGHLSDGSLCSDSAPCGAGLSCVTSSHGAGTCQPVAANLGDTCDPLQVAGPGCDARYGLTCAATTHTCALAQAAALGASCGDIDGQHVRCEGAASCAGVGSGGDVGVCMARCLRYPCRPRRHAASACMTGSPGAVRGFCELVDPAACQVATARGSE